MKHCLVAMCLAVLAVSAVAQNPPQQTPFGPMQNNAVRRVPGPAYSDLYCSGFVTSENVPRGDHIVGGWNSPDQARFADRDYIYIEGPGVQDGQVYSVVRELRDPNAQELYRGQRRELSALGSAYADMGRVRVLSHRNKVAIAQVEFSCDIMAAGDLVVPFVERQEVRFHPPMQFDRFAAPNGKATGRIVMAKDFDYVAGTGRKVYLDIGADKGVKPGDYLRVVRSADAVVKDPVDSIAIKAAGIPEASQKHPPGVRSGNGSMQMVKLGDFPRKSVGEMVVLNVNPKSATAMVTYAIEAIQVGDAVELEDLPPVPEEPPAPPAAAPPQPPTISCTARPSSVRPGESATIACQVSSPDNHPVNVAFTTTQGRLTQSGSNGVLDTREVAPGTITVAATATDDRNLTSRTTAAVSVTEPPPPPAPSKAADIQFKPNGTYVDNKAKAILDDLALRLQREPDAKIAIDGHAKTGTPAGDRIATARGNNIKTYLTRDKGIDAQRISTKSSAGGDAAEIWWVPAGAQPPQ